MTSNVRANAMLQVIIAQRNRALDDYAILAAECAELKALAAKLEKENQNAVDRSQSSSGELERDGGNSAGVDGELRKLDELD